MGEEVFCKEIAKDNSDYIAQLAKKYCIEKSFERKNRIFLHKESEFQSVKRIMERFKDQSDMEFDTIFKLYKLQNFKIDVTCFKGSQYKYQTLVNLKSHVKSSTLDDSITPKIITQRLINDFIKEIKSFSKPISKNLINTKRISDLLKCGSLTQEEIDFIKSEIQSRRTKKLIMEEKDMNAYLLTREQKINNYEIILNNVNKSASEISKLIPSMSAKSVANYLGYARMILAGKKPPEDGCPKLLIQVANQNLDGYRNIWNSKTLVDDLIKEKSKQQINCNKTKTSDEIFNIIIDNYKIGCKELSKLLPDVRYRSLTTYVSYVRGFEKGLGPKKHCPANLYKLWLQKHSVNKSSLESTELKISCNYILINNEKIITQNNSLEYLQGYIEAFKQTYDSENLKIYQLMD